MLGAAVYDDLAGQAGFPQSAGDGLAVGDVKWSGIHLLPA
jgi:hypothetical protein